MEFPEINWNRRGLSSLVKKIRKTESTDKRQGGGRSENARNKENMIALTVVDELVLSQEDKP